ncbi:MAG: hypothetical protein AAFR01_00655 [Pseudomonadota bacterium]
MNSTLLIIATLSAVTLGVIAVGADGREICVPRAPETAGQDVGYELIDILRREAWVTTDWTLEAYADFSPGLTALNWLKNDPRLGYAARATVLRSPGCDADGEFTYQTMFGRTFFHIADITGVTGGDLANSALTEGAVLKHHRLKFEADQTVSFIVSPAGESFVRVNRPINAIPGDNGLPEGWILQELTLASTWTADLIGEVRVLRLADGTSYQGPIIEMPVDVVHVQTDPSDFAEN